MEDRNIVAKTITIKGEKELEFIDIKTTLQNAYEYFVELCSGALFEETSIQCKERAELARYTVSKKLIDAFGISWKAAGHALSFLARGDDNQAFATVRRAMM